MFTRVPSPETSHPMPRSLLWSRTVKLGATGPVPLPLPLPLAFPVAALALGDGVGEAAGVEEAAAGGRGHVGGMGRLTAFYV